MRLRYRLARWACALATLLLPGLSTAAPRVAAQAPVRIIFLHHSVGAGLIEQGGVREGLTALGYEFYDHGYNGDGLRLADGSHAGSHFDVPGDNTDPDGLAGIFAEPLHDPPDNTFSHLLQYDVIILKSCFPVSNIGSDEQLAEYQSYYASIRDRMGRHPEKLFILVTQPPQVPGGTHRDEAARARALAQWLQSGSYLAGHPNIVVFDFFGLLAGGDNLLRPQYRLDDHDAHPNERANREIGPQFVAFVGQAVSSYLGEGPRPSSAGQTVTAPTAAPRHDAPPSTISPPQAEHFVEGFESGAGAWETSADAGCSIECAADSSAAHGGERSLRIAYTLAANGSASCGQSFDAPQDWSGSAGLSLWLRASQAGQLVTLMLFCGEPGAPTPFEVHFETTSAEAGAWQQRFFSWGDFVRAAWADAGGPGRFEPSCVTGYAFGLSAADDPRQGSLWIDDIGAAPGEVQSASPPRSSPSRNWCPAAALLASLAPLAVLAARQQQPRGAGKETKP